MKRKTIITAMVFIVMAQLLRAIPALRIFETDQSDIIPKTEETAPQEETKVFLPPQKPEPLVFAMNYEWNLLNMASLLRGYAYETGGRLTGQSGKTIAAGIAVKENDIFVFYAPDEEAQFVFYDAKGQFLSEMTVHGEWEQQIPYPQGCRSFSLCMREDALEKAILIKQSENLCIVSQKADIGYSAINSAVQAVGEGEILVFPGIYEEQVKAFGKNIMLYGVNRETCVIESTVSSYYAPPLEIAAGLVENMTIRAVNRNSASSALKAYAVHVEDHILCDNTLTFRNCTLYSDFNSAVGMGLRGGCEVTFEHCFLAGRENGLFCHDSAYQKYSGVQKLIMHDCIVAGIEGSNAIRLDSQGVKGALVELLFWNNEFISGDGTADNLLYVQNNNGGGTQEDFMGLKNFRLQMGSRENNIEELNFMD